MVAFKVNNFEAVRPFPKDEQVPQQPQDQVEHAHGVGVGGGGAAAAADVVEIAGMPPRSIGVSQEEGSTTNAPSLAQQLFAKWGVFTGAEAAAKMRDVATSAAAGVANMFRSRTKVGFVEDFTPDQLKIFEPRMYATNGPGSNWGILSKSGFLGDGESLKERVEADLNTCRELGTSPEKLIAELRSAIEDEQRFDVTLARLTGTSQACPFSPVNSVQDESPFWPVKGACHHSSGVIEIRNRQTGKTMKISPLAMHLVEAHHFFEGSVEHRIDVRELKQLLEHAGNDGIP